MKEYILESKKLIPSTICNKIISYFDNPNDLESARVGNGGDAGREDKKIRNCQTAFLLDKPNKTFGETIMLNYLLDRLNEAGKAYSEKFPHFNLQEITQLDLLKYEANTYDAGYKFHVDASGKLSKRILSMSICLNDKFEGGEFVFDLPNGEVSYQQNVGDLIMFPSNFMFPHQVNKINNGIRYALIAWAI